MNKEALLLNKIEAVIDCAKHEMAMLSVCVISEASTDQLIEMIIPEMLALKSKVIEGTLDETRVIHSYNYATNIWKWNSDEPSDLYQALKDLHDYYIQF